MGRFYHITTTALVFLFFIQITSALRTHHHTEKIGTLRNGGSISVCGLPLLEMLRFVCNNTFNPMYKRSEDTATELDYVSDMYEDSTYPFTNRHLAKALIPGSLRRSKRGVVDECCNKSCTIFEMNTYCAVRH